MTHKPLVAIQSGSIEVAYITSTRYTEQCARVPCTCRCMNTWSATQFSGMRVQQLWVNDGHQPTHEQTLCSWAIIMINMELAQFGPIQICILHRGITRIVYFEPTCKTHRPSFCHVLCRNLVFVLIEHPQCLLFPSWTALSQKWSILWTYLSKLGSSSPSSFPLPYQTHHRAPIELVKQIYWEQQYLHMR